MSASLISFILALSIRSLTIHLQLDNVKFSFPGDSVVKNPPANAGDMGSVPGLERSPGEGNSNPLRYSYPESSMNKGAWQAVVQGPQSPDKTGSLGT